MTTTSDGFVKLRDGTELPYRTLRAPLDLVVGHGLGAFPAEKSHRNDISTDIVLETLALLPPDIRSKENGTAVLYTARGHGESRGWEDAASKHGGTAMFHWPNLGDDMLSVAEACGLGGKFTVLGNSMGAASALFMTMAHPTRVAGLVMVRPPRAWEVRRCSAAGFIEDAEKLRKARPRGYHHLPILGAADTDLPPTEDLLAYSSVKCPVLVLSHGNDAAHPVETGKVLNELIPSARFEVARDEEEARVVWPGIIAEWLEAECFLDHAEE